MSTNPKACRREAEECRALAEQSSDPNERAKWLRLAEEWEKLALMAARKRDF